MSELEAGAAAAERFDAEAALVARVRAGEDAAFQELFRRYRRVVYGLGCRLLNDSGEADDLCQEVFLIVHRRIDTLRDPGRLRSWLCRIAVTRAQNVERSFRRRLRSLTVSLDDGIDPGSEPRSSVSDPERSLVSAEARARINAAIAALPFAFRTVVVLRDIEGLSYEEIAEAVDANVGTVKSRIARGREALRRQLQDLLAGARESRP